MRPRNLSLPEKLGKPSPPGIRTLCRRSRHGLKWISYGQNDREGTAIAIDLKSWIEKKRRVVLLDGAMGTLLAEKGWRSPSLPEEMLFSSPEAVRSIHEAYLEAGADIVETNSFGASTIKLSHRGLQGRAEEIGFLAARTAREALGDRALVAGSVGPLGRLVEPLGDVSFDEALAAFRPQIKGLLAGGADFILIETMLDLREAKAAVMALKEEDASAPFVVSFTFDRNGATMTGTTPEVAAAWAMAVGASALGANCGVGPDAYVDVVARMGRSCDLPLFVYANAGLPARGLTLDPESFAGACRSLVEAGASVVGGCCGTGPDHIAALAGLPLPRPLPGAPASTALASRSHVFACGRGEPLLIVGERINPSRKGPLKEAMIEGKWSVVRDEARLQTEAGASLLDVNTGIAGQDRQVLFRRAVEAVLTASPLPLSLDSDDLSLLDEAARSYGGVPLVNSVTCDDEPLARGLALARKTGSALVVLTLDGAGIPATVERRLALARKAVEAADAMGLPRRYLFIDPLTLTAGSDASGPAVTLESLRGLRELGARSILGISNVSFGLPDRGLLNRTFLAMALASGLDAVIANPLDRAFMETVAAGEALVGRDPALKRYIASAKARDVTGQVEAKVPERPSLGPAVVEGDREAALAAGEALLAAGLPPMALIADAVIPALEEVGRLYDCGDFFLPELLQSSQAAQALCDLAERRMAERGESLEKRGTVLLATVEGDLHDLGKKVVAMVLKSRGYRIVDVGVDVPADRILAAAREARADVVGLSALMTTTVEHMKDVIAQGREGGPEPFFIVGGAAVNAAFADTIGADGYAADAIEAARLVDRLMAARKGGE
ncbi:homocysteine S-methyltransferase family protein [Aminithiophilus ramosus]|uniref:Methionine synthase n=1 Tax=Aminithiophilus ramosus TaxID=3029084 RepID=A0A9Q7ALR9_9BACT|nr:homocysteine S-methyltransferase family protein [Aminithiophilus ramosus]